MNTQEFSKLISMTKRPVMAAIRRYLSVQFFHAIDDVAQEVYLRAYKTLVKKKIEDDSKLRSYLYTIAKNESLRMNDKLKRENEKIERYTKKISENSRMQIDKEGSEIKEFWEREQREKIKQVIHDMPSRYADILKLNFNGLSINEIMNELSLREGTVKSRLYRGLSQLRQNLKGV